MSPRERLRRHPALLPALTLLLASGLLGTLLRAASHPSISRLETSLARPDVAAASRRSLYDLTVPPFPGKGDYDAARRAIVAGRLEEAERFLERALDRNPRLTEAWYNLGAVKTRLALASDSPDRAVALVADAADAKRRALELMDEGEFAVWLTEGEQLRARADAEAALAGHEDLLSDVPALTTALRVSAATPF